MGSAGRSYYGCWGNTTFTKCPLYVWLKAGASSSSLQGPRPLAIDFPQAPGQGGNSSKLGNDLFVFCAQRVVAKIHSQAGQEKSVKERPLVPVHRTELPQGLC